MRSEKRSLAINEMKEVLKSELVTKICGGRVWVVRTVKKEEKVLDGVVEELENFKDFIMEQHRKTRYFNAEMKGASSVVFRQDG